MELGTLGAILRFALELEEKTLGFYQEATRQVGQPQLQELFREYARRGRRRRELLQRTRREDTAEMILEPITGFFSEDYEPDCDLPSGAGSAKVLEKALALEKKTARFYEVAASKVGIIEVTRAFRKLGRENAERINQIGKSTNQQIV